MVLSTIIRPLQGNKRSKTKWLQLIKVSLDQPSTKVKSTRLPQNPQTIALRTVKYADSDGDC